MLGVSRPSLREALLLESRGLVQVKQRGGGFGVPDVTGPTTTDPLVHLLQRHSKAIDDVPELRHGVERVAAYFAAIRATDADATQLRETVAAMKRRGAARDPLEDADLDVDFHMAIAEASHNVALLDEQHAQIDKATVARDHDAARAAASLDLNFIQASLRQIGKPKTAVKRTPAVKRPAVAPRRKS